MSDDKVPDKLDCGRSVEELSAYLEAGRQPYDRDIETCPDCLNAIESLQRVGQLSRDLVAEDAALLPAPPQSWFEGIFSAIHSELRAGRSIPITHPDPRVSITLAEGAVRSLLRSVGDSLDGVFIGRTEIVGDAEIPGAPVQVVLTATVGWGQSIPDVSETLRVKVFEALERHTELNVTAVDVIVEDIHGYTPKDER